MSEESLTCDACSRQAKGTRPPPGWHRTTAVLCPDCWGSRYVLRAITVPIAEPLDGLTWDDFGADIREAWRETTRLSNWALRELAKADDPAEKKPPRIYLYPMAREKYPELPSKSVNSVLHAVERKYRDRRWDINRSAESLPTFRYPTPFPIHNQGWKLEEDDGGRMILRFRLGDRRVAVRLRMGPEFKRQRAHLRSYLGGEAHKGELAILGRWVQESSHRSGITVRRPGGGNTRRFRTMAKLCLWVPVSDRKPLDGVLRVRTDPESFLVAVDQSDNVDPWVINADHVRRWVVAHRRRLDRFSDDQKHETRPAKRRRKMNDAREVFVKKHRDRLDSFCHQASMWLAKYAARRRVSLVEMDTTDRSWVVEFPWFEFLEQVRWKLSERGIELQDVSSGEVVSKTQKTSRD